MRRDPNSRGLPTVSVREAPSGLTPKVMAREDDYDAKVRDWSKRVKKRKAEQEAWIGGIILAIIAILSLGLVYPKHCHLFDDQAPLLKAERRTRKRSR